MRYITFEEVIAIHLEVLREFGGEPDILNLEHVKSSVETPQQTMFGDELYPTLESKAAILFFLLIKNHPFMDGNKRTAVLAMLEFLERNAFTLNTSNDELYEFTLDVATSRLEKDQITLWIQTRLRAT